MGFTVEDMMVVSADRYRMKLVAGKNGWSNSISWLLMLEDITITHNFTGKELAVTTGLGFPTTDKLMFLAQQLVSTHASGLLINTGKYIIDLPQELVDYCDENDFPLLTVPWDVILADLIKDLSIRIFLQGGTDEQISEALIRAIEEPSSTDRYLRQLLPHFDTGGTFQVVLIATDDLGRLDTVERRRLSYRMQLYLSNITHNGHFFYYDSAFVLVISALEESMVREIIRGFQKNIGKRLPGETVYIGVSDQVTDISHLSLAYHRALCALSRAYDTNTSLQYFSEMGLYRLLYSVTDTGLLESMSLTPLSPLLEYDREHNADYLETLENYLRFDGSIQAVSDAMFIHRNTILYRMNNIRALLGCSLSTSEERMTYQIACMIHHMHFKIRPTAD